MKVIINASAIKYYSTRARGRGCLHAWEGLPAREGGAACTRVACNCTRVSAFARVLRAKTSQLTRDLYCNNKWTLEKKWDFPCVIRGFP